MIFPIRSCWISIKRHRKLLFVLGVIVLCIAIIIFLKHNHPIKHQTSSFYDGSKSENTLRDSQKAGQNSGKNKSEEREEDFVNYNVHAFYYAWYKSPAIDGKWSHWNHIYIPNWEKNDKKVYPTGQHEPPEDIGSNYFPLLGCYSSRDSYAIHEHMKYFRQAGIGVLVLSWHPPNAPDDTTEVLPRIMDAALQYDIKISLHIEPYNKRDPHNLIVHLSKFMEIYGSHPALHRVRRPGTDVSTPKLPLYYIYDSYLTPSAFWKEMLSSKGNMSVRGTHLDGVFLGLLVEIGHRHEIARAHFDGFYTYFATNGFTYGSSWKNWRSLSKFALQNKLMFVPSVGPGYIDTQVRPWNARNTRHRGYGKYYGVAWRSALSLPVPAVSITSFNEWHEGTQIEPAVPFRTSSFAYLSYEPQDSFFYLNLTRRWVKEYTKKDKSAISTDDIIY